MGLKALASKLGNLSLSSWTQVKDKRERKKERQRKRDECGESTDAQRTQIHGCCPHSDWLLHV